MEGYHWTSKFITNHWDNVARQQFLICFLPLDQVLPFLLHYTHAALQNITINMLKITGSSTHKFFIIISLKNSRSLVKVCFVITEIAGNI